MVFQLLADKLRSVDIEAEFCISPPYSPNNLFLTEHGFSQSQLPAQHLRRQVEFVGRGEAGPCKQPAWQSRASRKQAGCGKPSEEQCAHVPTAVLRDQALSRQLSLLGW